MSKDKDLSKAIKELESNKRAKALKSIPKNEAMTDKVDMDVWYHLRSGQIPEHHMKEILSADFKGRGLSDKETMDAFDKALESYGVKLK